MLSGEARHVSKYEDPSLLLAKVKEYLDFPNLIWLPYLKQHPVLYEAMHDFLTPLHSMHHVKSADICDWDLKDPAHVEMGHAMGFLPQVEVSDDKSNFGLQWRI